MFFKTENDSDDDYSASSGTFPWLLELKALFLLPVECVYSYIKNYNSLLQESLQIFLDKPPGEIWIRQIWIGEHFRRHLQLLIHKFIPEYNLYSCYSIQCFWINAAML